MDAISLAGLLRKGVVNQPAILGQVANDRVFVEEGERLLTRRSRFSKVRIVRRR